MANPLDDSPPGAPAYASGPLAIKPPSAAAVRASGASPDSYFTAEGNARAGIPVVQPTPIPSANSGGLSGFASGLLARATNGLTSLFGNAAAATPEPVTAVPNRTAALESGLNALEMRSTGFRPPGPVTVVANSRADEYNKRFDADTQLTPAQFNAAQDAERAKSREAAMAYRQQQLIANQGR